MAAEALGIDLDNKFIKKRFFNEREKNKLVKSLIFKEVKYIKGRSNEKKLTKGDFKKYKNPNVLTDPEIKVMAKKIAEKKIASLKEQKVK